jgi:hypothetical protein
MSKTTIRQRAEAIIADAAQYTDDTRRAIQLSLERDSPKMLAELVGRAESGETVWYITGEPEAPTDDRSRLARDVASILSNPATPTGLYNALADEITEWSTAYLEADAHGESYIARSLDAFNRREAKRRSQA